MSATSNNVEALEWLVDDLGASPRGVDAEGNTLLHLAVASRCSDIIAWMLDDYGGHGHVDLLLSSDSQGINPVVKAVRSRYAEGIDAMCHDKEGVWHRACRPSSISAEHQSWLMIPFAAAYDEAHDALQVSSGSETDDEQLQIISRKLGVMLRLGVMEWIHNVCLESYEKAARLRSAKEGAACWECCKSQIVEYLESTRWWQGFSEQAETLERYDVEEVYEAQMLKSAAMAGQAALVEWLLDTWKVDFYLAQTYDDSYAIADFVCCPALLRQRAERDAAERMSSDWESPVETWYNMFDQDAQTNGSLQLPDIQNLILVILASVDVLTESERVYSHAFIEERKKMLRLLGFDDSLDVAELQHSNAVRILRILIDRYNECAMPSLDLLVRVRALHLNRHGETSLAYGLSLLLSVGSASFCGNA